MHIECNGEQLDVPENCLLTNILQQYTARYGSLAVAVNQNIIPASRWQHQSLEEGDVIDIFTLVAGG